MARAGKRGREADLIRRAREHVIEMSWSKDDERHARFDCSCGWSTTTPFLTAADHDEHVSDEASTIMRGHARDYCVRTANGLVLMRADGTSEQL